MRRFQLPIIAALVLLSLASAASAAEGAGETGRRPSIKHPWYYQGMCDASAAVRVSPDLFLAASDEDNALRLYSFDMPGRPLREFELDRFLGVTGKSLEADIEGAALIGSRAFWIGSHGRNYLGKLRLNRCGLFATDIRNPGLNMSLVPVGMPYKTLLEDLWADSRMARFHLIAASQLPPTDEGALNIEGLAATAEGGLLIGFRNPIPDKKALIVSLLNPNEVVIGKTARFGQPILLDLGGLGIRDLCFHSGSYTIIGGPHGSGGGHFQLFEWSGKPSDPPVKASKHIRGLTPEAVIVHEGPQQTRYFLLSDDGNLITRNRRCKDLPESQRRFRAFWVEER